MWTLTNQKKNDSLNEGFGRHFERLDYTEEDIEKKRNDRSLANSPLGKLVANKSSKEDRKEEDYDKSLAKNDSLNEATQLDKNVDIAFNGKTFHASIHIRKGSEALVNKIDSAIKALNNPSLFNYLYSYHKDLFDEINNDKYFDGKKINSGEDLKKSISRIDTVALGFGCVYIAGECWFDDEHGFSICFPNGKFVKSKYEKYNYKRDEGEDVKYCPQCTLLGQHSSASI